MRAAEKIRGIKQKSNKNSCKNQQKNKNKIEYGAADECSG
jgi:hypothetical protein